MCTYGNDELLIVKLSMLPVKFKSCRIVFQCILKVDSLFNVRTKLLSDFCKNIAFSIMNVNIPK